MGSPGHREKTKRKLEETEDALVASKRTLHSVASKALRYAKELRGDREVVLAAVANNGWH